MIAYTNDSTDLALKVLKLQFHNKEKGYKKVKALLFNKKNGIIYERKAYTLSAKFFKWNTLQEIECQLK